MFKTSVELNRALEGLCKLSDTLGTMEAQKVCRISEEDRINAIVKMLKIYEICVRIDEALADISRHKGTEELNWSIERAKNLIKELTGVISGSKTEERRMLLAYLDPEFKKTQNKLASLLKNRPSDRIWRDERIYEITEELSDTIKAVRKSAAYALLVASSADIQELSKVVC